MSLITILVLDLKLLRQTRRLSDWITLLGDSYHNPNLLCFCLKSIISASVYIPTLSLLLPELKRKGLSTGALQNGLATPTKDKANDNMTALFALFTLSDHVESAEAKNLAFQMIKVNFLGSLASDAFSLVTPAEK